MANLLEQTQHLVGNEERVQYAFFADEGSSGDWVYGRSIDWVYFFGPLFKTFMARPRIVTVTDKSIVLMRGGTWPRAWAHPKAVIDRMPLGTPVVGELTGKSGFFTLGKHRLWVREPVFQYVERLRTLSAPA